MNRRQRRQLREERVYGDRRHPRKYSAPELRTLLVEDACAGFGPASQASQGGGFTNGMAYMEWQVVAFQRIAAVEHKPLDTVFVEVRDEVTARTGGRYADGMPL